MLHKIMRCLQKGKKERTRANKYIMLMFLAFILLHWISNFFYFIAKLGFSYQSISEYFVGNPDKFLMPKTALGLLEVTHVHLFTMGILLLAITHILALFPLKEKTKVWISSGVFLSAFLDILSGWLIRFVHPGFSYLKMLSFLSFQICLLWIIITCLVFYTHTPKS